jgi:hypothetical protein
VPLSTPTTIDLFCPHGAETPRNTIDSPLPIKPVASNIPFGVSLRFKTVEGLQQPGMASRSWASQRPMLPSRRAAFRQHGPFSLDAETFRGFQLAGELFL